MTHTLYICIAVLIWMASISCIVKLHKMEVTGFEYEDELYVLAIFAGLLSATWIIVAPILILCGIAKGILNFFMKVIK